MNTTGNTILITGGSTGIGRGLAEHFHDRGNRVIITGRRQAALDKVVAARPGMASYVVDVTQPGGLSAFARQVVSDHPRLNVLINNAGIMEDEDALAGPAGIDIVDRTIATNLTAPIHLTAHLLPHLLAQPEATVIGVTSGLAFVPLARTPTYSATKAALHSYLQSLRYQLRETAVAVIEIAPPYVQTQLQGERQASDPHAMPLADYLTETMALLGTDLPEGEVLVQRVLRQRFAERDGNAATVFGFLNPAV